MDSTPSRAVSELLQLAGRWEPFLLQLPSEFGDLRAGTRWSVREVLGHLVDSAHFHRALWLDLCATDVEREPYDQNLWVERSGWRHYPWQDLVRLWAGNLRLMASVADGLPESALSRRWISTERTLEDCLRRFPEHQRHHLAAVEKALG